MQKTEKDTRKFAKDLVTVEATEKAKHMKSGEKYQVTPENEKILIKKGFAKKVTAKK